MKLAERWETVSVWLNEDVAVRRIDIVLAVFGIFCVAYCAYYDGVPGALVGGLMYFMVVMISVWML